MEAKYKIGDKVWYARSGTREKKIQCPDCFGKRFLTVILGDDSHLPIPCENCSWSDQDGWGYREPYSHGYIRHYEWFAEPQLREITGMEITPLKVEYTSSLGGGSYYRIPEEEALATEEEARVKAEQLCAEHNAKELEKIATKEKPKRTWAWNMSYHRSQIKVAERQLAYHQAKLITAKSHLKEDKELKVNDGK